MTKQMTIEELLTKYESFKKKGLNINEQDLFNRLELQDLIQDKMIETKSQYLEDKLEFDRDYGIRLIELKEIKDASGRKKYTDTTAKAVVDDEFFQKELDLNIKKTTYEMLQNKASNCIEYVNVLKLSMRKDFSI